MTNKHDKNLKELLENLKINDFDEEKTKDLEELHNLSINQIKKNNGELLQIPPFEKHPYIEDLDIESNVAGLMIGTFPPITYLCDTLSLDNLTFKGKSSKGLKKPKISYFHGNEGTFWDFAPIDFPKIINYPNRSNRKEILKEELSKLNIHYTDIIRYCQRKLGKTNSGKVRYTANDTDLHNIVLNNQVVDFLLKNNSINRIYFTNSCLFGKSGNFFSSKGEYSLTKNDAFQLFLKSLNSQGLNIEIFFPNSDLGWININENKTMTKEQRLFLNINLKTKVVAILRLKNKDIQKTFYIASCVSPAATSKNRNTSQKNPCVMNYSTIHKVTIEDSPKALLKETISAFFNDKLDEIIVYNE
jgi:hypothetical protein